MVSLWLTDVHGEPSLWNEFVCMCISAALPTSKFSLMNLSKTSVNAKLFFCLKAKMKGSSADNQCLIISWE